MIRDRNIDPRADIDAQKMRMTLVTKSADYVLADANDVSQTREASAGDMGKTFVGTKAGSGIDFTLPTPSAANKGFTVTFIQTIDHSVTFRCASSNSIIGLDNLAATIGELKTSSQKIGATATFLSDGSKWILLHGNGVNEVSG